MQHLSLYRKYRPQSFKDVIGQESIVTVLEGEIKNDTIAHAYLFTGSRGTGKTSFARIFANAMQVDPVDIHEIDAASYRLAEDIKDVREHMQTLPIASTRSVYILDEVHMLSSTSFAMLLKMIEEPPRHLIIILATTELDKVPDTIISRCQTMHFKKPTRVNLVTSCEHILKLEKRELPREGIELIAAIGDGSYRDMQSTLEKVLSSTDAKKIPLEHVTHVLGAPSHSVVMEFLRALNTKDSKEMLSIVKNLSVQNVSASVFLRIVLVYVRAIMFARFDAASFKDEYAFLDADFIAEMKKEGSNITSSTLAKLIELLNTSERLFDPELALIVFATEGK